MSKRDSNNPMRWMKIVGNVFAVFGLVIGLVSVYLASLTVPASQSYLIPTFALISFSSTIFALLILSRLQDELDIRLRILLMVIVCIIVYMLVVRHRQIDEC